MEAELATTPESRTPINDRSTTGSFETVTGNLGLEDIRNLRQTNDSNVSTLPSLEITKDSESTIAAVSSQDKQVVEKKPVKGFNDSILNRDIEDPVDLLSNPDNLDSASIRQLHNGLLEVNGEENPFDSLSDEERRAVDDTIYRAFGEERGQQLIEKAEAPTILNQEQWTGLQLSRQYNDARQILSATGETLPQESVAFIKGLRSGNLSEGDREKVENTIVSAYGGERGQELLDTAYGEPQPLDYSADRLQILYLHSRDRIRHGVPADAPWEK